MVGGGGFLLLSKRPWAEEGQGVRVPPTPAGELGACPGRMRGLTYLGSFVADLSSQTPGPLRARVSLLEERPS